MRKGECWEAVCRVRIRTWRSISQLWSVKNAKRKLIAVPFCVLATFVLFSWTKQSNSCALHSFFALILFDVVTLLGDLISQCYTHGGKPSTAFSFGYVRVEVLAHFSVLCLGLLLNSWALKIALELVLGGANQEIHTGRFLPSVVIGGLVHFFLSFHNNPFMKVSKVSATYTTLQKYFQGICASFGLSLSSSSTFSLSPFAILGTFTVSTITVLAFALQSGPRWFDLVGGVLIIFAIFDALWPLCIYTGQVLLQTVPSHIVTQLEKALREALTIDGVLEFRNELFWTLTYGQIAGTLHVRVRRDANEQLVLSKVYEKLHPLAPHLTVQITKDDFGRTFGSLQILRDAGTPLTKVTICNNDISPILNAGNNNHVLYSTSGSSHHSLGRGPYSHSAISISNLNSAVDDTLSLNNSRRSVTSSTSSMFNMEAIPHANVHNHLNPAPLPARSTTSYNNPSIPYYNGRHNPFVTQETANNANNVNQTNLLISSANYFPET